MSAEDFETWLHRELHAALAEAWRRGAEFGFASSGEGWNGEYADGPDPDVAAIVAAWHNPYETREE